MDKINLHKILILICGVLLIGFTLGSFLIFNTSHVISPNVLKIKNPSLIAFMCGASAFCGMLLLFLFFRLFSLMQNLHFENKTNQIQEIQINKTEIQINAIDIAEKKKAIQQNILLGLDKLTKIEVFAERLLSNIANEYEIVQGIFFLRNPEKNNYELTGTYAFYSENTIKNFDMGEGISGQVAKNKRYIKLTNIPKGYITIISGLGKGTPQYLVVVPILFQNETIAVIELASFKDFSAETEEILMETSHQIASIIVKLTGVQ